MRTALTWHAVISLAAAALLVGSAASCTVTRDGPNLVGQDIRLTIIHTSDIHARLFPYYAVPNTYDEGYGLLPENAPFGGIARMATVIRQERDRAGRSLWLDSGDCFQGAPVFNMFKGEAEVRALSEAGLDAAVIGNHEFDLGADNFYNQADRWSEFRTLAANYLFEDPPNPQQPSLKDVTEPYAIFDVEGVKVGVIGMANWSSMTGIFEAGNSLGIRPREDAQVVREYVRLLRPAVDVVILLSHLGLEEDENLGAHEVDDMNEYLPLEGVDLILGGHLHIVLNPPKLMVNDAYGNKTVLAHSGAFAKYVGRLDLVVKVGDDNTDPDRRSKVLAFSYDNIPIDATIPDDAAISELLWPYSVELNREFDLDGVFAYVDTEGSEKILRNHPAGGDSQLGNLVARSMQLRSGIEAEIAITNSLGIRADFEHGPLTIEQMFNVFPFENTITVIYLSGSEIQETLDFVARRSASRGCRAQAQVAGLTFDMVCSSDTCPDGRLACAKNIYLGEDCRGGNSDGPVDPSRCAPLEPTGLYKVAVNDYIAKGGSGFEVLKRNTSKQFTNISLRDALIDYLRTQPRCAPDVVDSTDPGGQTVLQKWGNVACLDHSIEPHDGRIRPTFE